MTPPEFRALVAAVAQRILDLFDQAGVSPSHEVTMAMGLLFAAASKQTGITREAFLEAAGDAYDYGELYMKGEAPE